MQKVGMLLLVLLGGCLCGGCTSTLAVGPTQWNVESIPAGMYGWRIEVSRFRLTSSVDPVKMVEFVVQDIKAFVGMLPPG